MRFVRLLDCQEWRDGGSYSASFSTDHGEPFSLWLHCVRDPAPAEPWYTTLVAFEGPGPFPGPGSSSISKGSDEERHVFQLIDEFLAATLDDSLDSDAQSLQRLRTMRHCMARRGQ